MFRIKGIFGNKLKNRTFSVQQVEAYLRIGQVEAYLRIGALNKMTALGLLSLMKYQMGLR
jgi:hypothetical protein